MDMHSQFSRGKGGSDWTQRTERADRFNWANRTIDWRDWGDRCLRPDGSDGAVNWSDGTCWSDRAYRGNRRDRGWRSNWSDRRNWGDWSGRHGSHWRHWCDWSLHWIDRINGCDRPDWSHRPNRVNDSACCIDEFIRDTNSEH